jgi:membrane protein DedA with SNARE-associated domain
MGDLVPDIARWALGAIHSLGYVGVFVLVVSGSLIFPPSEITLPLIGFLVGQGCFSFTPVLTAALAARVMASLILYYLGLWTSEERLRRLVKRIERFRLLFRSDLNKTSELLERHQGKSSLGWPTRPRSGCLDLTCSGRRGHDPSVAVY